MRTFIYSFNLNIFRLNCNFRISFKLLHFTTHYSTFISSNRFLDGKLVIERNATIALRLALENCKACQIKKPECSDVPNVCFPEVECRDTFAGPVCGPCPEGWCGDGKVHTYLFETFISIYENITKVFICQIRNTKILCLFNCACICKCVIMHSF